MPKYTLDSSALDDIIAKAWSRVGQNQKIPVQPESNELYPMPPRPTGNGPSASDLLDEASEIVRGARNQTHGDKERSFAAIASLWTAYLMARRKPFGPIRPHDVAYMMSELKRCRAEWGTPVRDHGVDDAGYAAIGAELALGQGPKA